MEILYPLTHPQKRVWYIEKMYPSTSVNNIGGFTRIKGDIDFDLLEKSINIYIQQNDAVRLRMVEREQEPLQYVTEFEYMTLDRMDFRTSEDPEQEFQNWIQKTVQKPFDLIEQPLFYIALYRINEQEGGYLLKYHHLIFDGWSASIMTKQVTTIYEALKHNQELPQVVSTNYLEYLDKEEAYLASPRCQKNKNYWLEKFKTLPDISNIKSTDDLKGNRKRFNLSSEQTLGVNNWIQEHKCSMNDFFSLIWLIYNYKHLQTDDLVIGFPLLNRSGVKEKQTIGMFTATMPFRIKIEKDMSIVELLKYLTSELKSCYTNYKYPYNLLAQDLGLRQQGYATLFTSCINYYNTQHTLSMDGCEVINEEFYNGCQTYSIQLIVKQWTSNGNINVDIDYKINDYDEKEIEELFRAITVVIEQVINKPDILVKNISLLSKKEEFELIYIFNQTEVEYPSDKNIIELFREQVKDKPDKVAIQHYGTYITYSELDQKSDRVAAYLNEVGIGKNQFVGIMATHSIELLVAIFGILKIGAAYVPINESLPSERIQYMVEDANIKYIMTNIQGQLGFIKNCQCIQIEDAYKENKNLVEILVEPESNAYVIYTSGSTGKPKGVLISQRSLVNYIVWAKKMYVTDENDAFALYSSISFDLTVTSIFTPLISGCKLVIYEENESEHALYRIMRERQVTVLKLTPAHLMLIKDLDNRLSTIRKLIVGGEELKTYIARQVYESFDSNVDICNEYGPTEATVGCMIYRFNVNENIEESVPIGIPAQNVQIYILDEQLKPVPKGMIGEMYISGDGLAKGYLNRPQLTQQCFIHNPFIEGRYMYKTGDLATFSYDNNIIYKGRVDEQVKINGYRIELGEIEKRCIAYKGVKQAVAVCCVEGESKFLGMYIVTSEEIDESELKAYLSGYVPNYMIPAVICRVEEIPLTINGKVDKKKLPLIQRKHLDNDVIIRPQTEEEIALSNVVKEILGLDTVNMIDNFYNLGGDSIKAIQLTAYLAKRGYQLTVRQVLEKPILNELAKYITKAKKDIEEVPEGKIQLSPILKWFFAQNLKNPSFYNQSIILKLMKLIEVEVLEKIMNLLIAHHDSLRFNVKTDQEEVYYNNEHLNKSFRINSFDLCNLGKNQQWQQVEIECDKLKKGFNLYRDLLINAAVFKLSETENYLFLTAHHIVMDSVSWQILLDDINTLLGQYMSGEALSLPQRTTSYQKWVKILNEYSRTISETEKIYWNHITSGYKKFQFISEVPVQEEKYEKRVISLSEETTSLLLNSGDNKYHLKQDEILVIALGRTFGKIFELDELYLNLESHGRELIDEQMNLNRTVGWFTSIYPVELKLYEVDMDTIIKSIKEKLRSVPKCGIDFGLLNEPLKKGIYFNYLGRLDNNVKSPYFEILPLEMGLDYGKNEILSAVISFNLMIIDNKLQICLEYISSYFSEEKVQGFLELYKINIEETLKYCMNKEEIEYTPSDFEAVELTQEDLESIFE